MTIPDWFTTLQAAVSANPALRQALGFTVNFVTPAGVRGIDLGSGNVLEGSVRTSCVLSASDDVFRGLVTGAITMQKAHVTGVLELGGDAEKLLKLYHLFDSCIAASTQ
jgi:hypothetical protein